MRDSFICPYCGGFMEYVACNGSFICDTCCYIIREDGSDDFSEMEQETEEVKMHKFLVQKVIDNEVYGVIYTETQLISFRRSQRIVLSRMATSLFNRNY